MRKKFLEKIKFFEEIKWKKIIKENNFWCIAMLVSLVIFLGIFFGYVVPEKIQREKDLRQEILFAKKKLAIAEKRERIQKRNAYLKKLSDVDPSKKIFPKKFLNDKLDSVEDLMNLQRWVRECHVKLVRIDWDDRIIKRQGYVAQRASVLVQGDYLGLTQLFLKMEQDFDGNFCKIKRLSGTVEKENREMFDGRLDLFFFAKETNMREKKAS